MTAIDVERRRRLDQANIIRARRAALKRELRAGTKDAATVIANPPRWAEGMAVYDLLLAKRYWGDTKAGKLIRTARVDGGATISSLTPPQREGLLAGLREAA